MSLSLLILKLINQYQAHIMTVQLDVTTLSFILQQEMINQNTFQLNNQMIKAWAPLATDPERSSLLLAVCFNMDEQEGMSIFNHYDNDKKHQIVAHLTNIIKRAKEGSLNQQQTQKLCIVKEKFSDIITSCCSCQKFENFLKEQFFTFKSSKQPISLLFTGIAALGYFIAWIKADKTYKFYPQMPALLLTFFIFVSTLYSFVTTAWKNKIIRQISISYQIHNKDETFKTKGVLSQYRKPTNAENQGLSQEESEHLAKFRSEKAINASFTIFLGNLLENQGIKQNSSPADIYAIYKQKNNEQKDKFCQSKSKKLTQSWERGDYEELMNLRKTFYLLEREQLLDTWRVFFLNAIDRYFKTEYNIREVLSLMFNFAVGVTKIVTFVTGYEDSQIIAQLCYASFVGFLILVFFIWVFVYCTSVKPKEKPKETSKKIENQKKEKKNNESGIQFSNQAQIFETRPKDAIDDSIRPLQQAFPTLSIKIPKKEQEIKVKDDQSEEKMGPRVEQKKGVSQQLIIEEL